MVILATIALLLHLIGYYKYVQKTLLNEIEPNPTSWIMFAYGTGILTILEWDVGANFILLVMPIACAISSLIMAGICFKRGKFKIPKSKIDRVAFFADVIITILYTTAWLLDRSDVISPEVKQVCVIVFLILSNLTTVTAFTPMIRSVIENPSTEHPTPWIWWSAAYVALVGLTLGDEGGLSFYLVYPVVNFFIHAFIFLKSRSAR